MRSRWPTFFGAAAIIYTAILIIFFNKATQFIDWAFYILIAAYLLRQTERYLLPGGYRKWFSTDVHKKYSAQKATLYNYIGIVALVLAAIIGSKFSYISLVAVFFMLYDSVFTLFLAVIKREKIPGLVSTILFVLPTIYLLLSRMVESGSATLLSMIIAAVLACGVVKYFLIHLHK